MKPVLYIIGAIAALVVVRRVQLGHMPHSLRELNPWAKCCEGCAAGAGCGGSPALGNTGIVPPRGDLAVYESPPLIGTDGESVGLPEVVLFRTGGGSADAQEACS